MIDVFDFLEAKRKNNALDQLQKLQLRQAPNMEKAEYERFVQDLMKTAGIKQEQKFDRDKMDALHAFTASMMG